MSQGVLSGKVALITGASQGIGRAIAVLFASAGAKVIINYWGRADAERGKETAAADVAKSISANGGHAVPIEADVANPLQVDNLIQQALTAFGRIDVLINNAGIRATYAPVEAMSLEDWQRILAVNLTGPFLCCRAALPTMLARGSGKVINMASELALVGRARLAHYCASKAGLIALTKSLAREVGARGIQVNAIAPGPTDTEFLGPLDRAPESIEQLPLRRLGRPEEIAHTALFLASPAGDWYAGQVLSPNGGTVM